MNIGDIVKHFKWETISDEEKKLILRDNALRLLATTGRP